MLGKIYKHEWKAMSRYLLPIHFIGLLLAVCGGFLFTMFADKELNTEIIVFVMLGTILIFMALSFGTIFLVAIQYYSSLFSDEAYLTHTLPVKKTSILQAKIVLGSMWIFIDGLICTAGIFMWTIPFLPEDALNEMIGLYTNSVIPLPLLITAFFITMVTGCFASSLLIYTCISIGQFFTNHRILGAVIAYIVINSVMQIIIMLTMTATGVLNITFNATANGIPNMHSYLIMIFLISFIGAAVEIIAGYFICRHTLEKSVNLN